MKKTKYVHRVPSNRAPALENVGGPRVKRLLSAFASLVMLPGAGEQGSSTAALMAARSSSNLKSSKPARHMNPSMGRQASARAAWRRAKLFA